MYADETVLLFFSKKSKEIENTFIRKSELLLPWFKNNSLVRNFKTGKTEVVLYGTTKKLHSQAPCNISILGSPINNENKYEYPGITLCHHLTLTYQSIKVLKTVSQCLQLLKRVRSNLNPKTAAAIYHTMTEPIILYCAPIYLDTRHTIKR